MGRRAKPYVYNGKTIDGLWHAAKGNLWRITAAKPPLDFRANTPEEAIARLRRWQTENQRSAAFVSVARDADPSIVAAAADALAGSEEQLEIIEHANGDTEVGYNIDETPLWRWVQKQYAIRPDYVMQMLGAATKESVPLSTLRQTFAERTDMKPKPRKRTLKIWQLLCNITEATTLSELTTERLLSFREHVKGLKLSPSSVSLYFSMVKTVIAWGRKNGLDARDCSEALERCKVLFIANATPKDAQPITRDDLHKLLGVASPRDTAIILFALNACLHLSEVLQVKWEEIDMKAKTFVSRRSKTKVARVAVLWDRTIAALKTLKDKTHTGPAFKSNHKGAYHINSYYKVWTQLRQEAGVAIDLEFDSLRDGAYSHGTATDIDFTLTKILAGHSAGGKSDHYIMRNPGQVAKVCERIETVYFGTSNK